jgi:LacI family transcriptional regulator
MPEFFLRFPFKIAHCEAAGDVTTDYKGGATRMANKPVRLKDVAEAVGVSINTVSCVLNPRNPGNVKVSQATRTAILKAARRLGYRRNSAAARLVGCRTKTLGILINSLTHLLTAPIVDAFEEQAVSMGYHCFIGCTRGGGLRKLEYVEQFLSHGVDGLLLTTIWNDPEVEHALKIALDTNLPTVFIDNMWEARPAALICGNHFQGGQLLAEHLLQVGHRQMAFLCDEDQRNMHSINERIRGIRSVLEESGDPSVHLDLLWSPTHHSRDFARVAHERLRQSAPPTAVLCAGDLTAIELIIGLKALGVEVPRDVCVTGYDDLLAPYIAANLHLDGQPLPWNLPLTTVRQPISRIGATAAQVLIEQIEGTAAEQPLEHFLNVELIPGQSSIPTADLLARI